jgi:hypothetical protein
MNNEVERMWKEAVAAYFKISWNLPGGTEENHGGIYLEGLRKTTEEKFQSE